MYKNILLPLDLNHESSWQKALPVALELCGSFGAKLHVMTVVPNFGSSYVAGFSPADFERKALDQAQAALAKLVEGNVPDGVEVQQIVANGTVYEEVLSKAGGIGADLIVMASHRPELQDYLLGPNAVRVVRHAEVSVMVVRD